MTKIEQKMTTQTKTTLPDRSREAKAGWRKVKLGEVLELKYGFGLPDKKRSSGSVPVFGSSGIVGAHDQPAVKSDGIIVGRKGNVGSVYYSDKPFYPIDTVYFVDKLKTPGDLKFFYYLLQRIPFGKIGSDVGVPGLNRDIAYGLDISVPENTTDQKRIADILSAFDDKIELNNKISRTLEQMAQAIFKEWFVNFRFPGHEKVKMVDSELGKIPEGWEVKSLDEIANFLNGLALQKYRSSNNRDGLPVIKIREMNNGIDKNTELASSSIDEKYKVKAGDILFSWSGSLELMRWTEKVGALNQHLFKVTSNDYPDWFIFYWTQKHLPFFRVIASGKATSMGHIQRHHLSEAQVIVPSSEIITKADEIISPMFKNILELRLENQKLAALRDLLLPKLMRGEIRV